MKILIKKLNAAAQVPVYASAGAACFDLHAIDNDGCHYQSAALAGWLEVARKAGIRPMLRLEKAPNEELRGRPLADGPA